MGQVVPFIARVRDSGDWTTAERARLQDLADRLSASGVDIEVIYGATDEGDPWCVVTDGSGDVLIHVARIDGKFVVHSAVDDAVNESVDLHVALRERLEVTEEAVASQSATILPFGLTARQGQTFLALVVAAAFFYETAGVGESAEAAALPPELPTEPEIPPPADVDPPAQERDLATQGATLQQTATGAATAIAAIVLAPPEPPAASAPPAEEKAPPPSAPIEPPDQSSAKADLLLGATARAEPATVIRGSDGDDALTGTSADEHIIGGAGNDTLRGGGGHDLLEGGAGDDRIELTSDTTALGGEGADTFVIQAPVQLGHADTLLGVVLDFSALDGDKLVTSNGQTIKVPPRPTPGPEGGTPTVTTDGGDRTGGGGDFTGQGVDPTHPTAPPTPSPADGRGDFGPTLVGPTLTRVDVDFNGDGVIDGYVLVASAGHAPSQGDGDAITVTGRTLGGEDAFG